MSKKKVSLCRSQPGQICPAPISISQAFRGKLTGQPHIMLAFLHGHLRLGKQLGKLDLVLKCAEFHLPTQGTCPVVPDSDKIAEQSTISRPLEEGTAEGCCQRGNENMGNGDWLPLPPPQAKLSRLGFLLGMRGTLQTFFSLRNRTGFMSINSSKTLLPEGSCT
jgi:hypothetical protein